MLDKVEWTVLMHCVLQTVYKILEAVRNRKRHYGGLKDSARCVDRERRIGPVGRYRKQREHALRVVRTDIPRVQEVKHKSGEKRDNFGYRGSGTRE